MGCCCSNAVSNADDPSGGGGDGAADGADGKRGGLVKDGPTSFKVMSIKASGKSGSGTAVSELARPRTQLPKKYSPAPSFSSPQYVGQYCVISPAVTSHQDMMCVPPQVIHIILYVAAMNTHGPTFGKYSG